jgi:hypothetical protein
VTSDMGKYQSLVGSLFLRKSIDEEEYEELFIITNIQNSSSRNCIKIEFRFLKNLREMTYNLDISQIEMFLKLKNENKSEFLTQRNFMYSYKFIG